MTSPSAVAGTEGFSSTLLDAMQTTGRQFAHQSNQGGSVVLNGRPVTRSALREYLAASDFVHRTRHLPSEEGGGGATRDIWHRDIGGAEEGALTPSVGRTFIPVGPSVSPQRTLVGGPTAPGHSQRYPSTNVTTSGMDITPGGDIEATVRHANQLRGDFPETAPEVVHQGSWGVSEEAAKAKETAGKSTPAEAYVAFDASQEFRNNAQAVTAMHDRGEEALFWPHGIDEVYSSKTDPQGISDKAGGAEFRQHLPPGKK